MSAAGPGRDGPRDQVPPGVDALQAAAQEAIEATRALLDVAEAFVTDPEVAERIGSVVRAASGAAARAARATGARGPSGKGGDDDPDDGIEHIPVG